MSAAEATRPLVVLDDDPTGTQAVAGVPVLFEWEPRLLARAAERGALHLLTNSRAFPPERARAIVREAAAATVEAVPHARLLLRGDSTLRAHLVEEYLGLCEGAHGDRRPPLLLVPALPAAGRITLGGVHLIERGGARVPLHETEYARDPSFSYASARLAEWAQERSAGLFRADEAVEVPLERLRAAGGEAVAQALGEAAGRPVAVVPDAETVDDLELIADGVRRVDLELAIRAAPTFAGVLGRDLATGFADPPSAPHGVLVVCGSWVPTTTRQLAALEAAFPGSFVEVDVRALVSDDAAAEIARAGARAGERLERARVAVVTTPRERDPSIGLAEGERLAVNLARVVRAVSPAASVVAAKGGITSAVTVRAGLHAQRAEVVGPLTDGVALWRAETPAGPVPYVVFPGNVGGDDLLAEVVAAILAA